MQGNIAKAGEIFNEACEASAKFGHEKYNDHLLELKGMLAGVYCENRQTRIAVKLYEDIVKNLERLDEDDSKWVINQMSLAHAYLRDGRSHDALHLVQHVVKLQEKLPETHPERLRSLEMLGYIYFATGKFNEVIELIQYILAKQDFKSHLAQVTLQNSLAMAYLTVGQTPKAIALLTSIVELEEGHLEKILGWMVSHLVLAQALKDNGQISEARHMRERYDKIKRQQATLLN